MLFVIEIGCEILMVRNENLFGGFVVMLGLEEVNGVGEGEVKIV